MLSPICLIISLLFFFFNFVLTDTDGNGEISPTEFQLFINNYDTEINCSLFSNDILEDNENDNENGSEISQELGVLCMLIRSHFLSPDYVKKTEDTNLSPLQKFYSDITSCIAKSEKKISEREGSIVDSECDFKLFLDILMKYEINLLIGDIGIKLIQKAFCTCTNTSKIRATDFISWMQSAGESSVEGVVSGVSAVGVIDIPKIIIPTTTVPVTSPVPVPARTGSSTNITPISKPGSEKQKQPTTSEKLKLSTSSEKLKLAIATASSSSVVQVQVPAVGVIDNKDNGGGNSTVNTGTSSRTGSGSGSGSAVSSGKQKEGSEKQPVEIEKNPVVSDEIPVETDVDLNRVYDDRDLFFSGVVVEGLALMQKTMHHLQISVVIGENTQYASVCPAKERGTAKRTFKVDWKAIKVKAADFKSQSLATITMTAKGQNSDEEWEATNTVKLSQFMVALNTTFNVVLQLKLPPHVGDSADTVDGIKVSPKTRTAVTASSEVMITLTGTSREASEAASRRISMMKTADLIRVTFDPLPADDDFSSPVISASGSPTHGTPTGQRSLSLTGMNKITDNFSTLNMIAEGRDSEIDFGVDGEMIDIIPASTGAVAAPRVRTQSQSRPQSQGQSQNQTQSGSQPRSGSQFQVPNVSNVNTPSQDRDSGKQVNDTQRTPSRRMSDLTQDESQFQGKGQDTNKDDDVEVDVEVDAPVTPPTDDSPPHEPMSFDEYLASSYQDNDSDDEEMKDYDIDFSPDTVTQTPETLLSPVKKSITKIDNKEKDKVQEKVPIIADTKTAQKESIKSKTEIIPSPEAYDDDDYEVDFEDF